jgi:prolyl oligopeptidase
MTTTPPPSNPTPAPDAATTTSSDDPNAWLEDVSGDKALAWAREQNKRSQTELEAIGGFDTTRTRILAILDSKDKIAWVVKRNKYLYNFWQDDAHPRGLWRRTSLAEYKKPNPAWEVLLDLDALNKAESESWVWGGADCLYPKYERCLISLSRGGADATVVREFDITKKAFVTDGFTVPEAKTSATWKDLDTLFIGTDFGPGSMTESGYPRIVKEWKRGTPLSAATTLFEGKHNDISVSAAREHDHGKIRDVVSRAPSFFTEESHVVVNGKLVKIDKPDDASVGFWDDQIILTLRSDWTVNGKTWPAGTALAANEQDYYAGKREFTALFTPKPNSSLGGVAGLKTHLLVTELEDVHDLLYLWQRTGTGAARTWKRDVVATPPLGSFSVWPWDDDENDDYWVSDSSFVEPSNLALVANGKKDVLKHSPKFFDASNVEVTQHFVTSKDGTRVPYFLVAKKNLPLDGSTPTLIQGYGGFEVSLTPSYDPLTGAAWIERGGAYVVPNLRGGGEYGPKWHQAAVKENRQKAYDDFAAIAEDLIARKVTRPERLGIMGGSNGGLLVGVMMTQRPELFGAVVCEAPLLDMKRYAELLAGASWMEEYGDPKLPAEWAFISKYSPYHNVHKGKHYPRVLFTTSTRDDRVHPGHARKMAARMLEQGHDVLFYENIEGGHGGSADNMQRAFMSTLAYAFLWKQLGL